MLGIRSLCTDGNYSFLQEVVCYGTSHYMWRNEKWKGDSLRKIQQNATMYKIFYYCIFIWSSTCFGQHAAHHQEPKTALTDSGFSYMKGCFDLWLVDVVRHSMCLTMSTDHTSKQPFTYEKPKSVSAVLGSWWWAVCRPKHVELHINME
jgi:hypothetical protein